MGQRLLAVFAHPDDEAFGTGGTLAHYAAAGTETTLVCATRGEVGEIADPSFASPETLGQVREQELQCSVEAMGVDRLILLGYRDSGMVGTAENEDCRAYINAPEGEVIVRLVAILRQARPHVVVTFEPNGGYGHPDHIAAHHHTVKAFHLAADPAVYPELGPAWQPDRLFYTAIPRSFFRKMREGMVNLGMDTTDFDRRMGDDAPGWPDEAISAILDVSDSVAAKWDALHCHRTQFGPGNLFRQLPDETVKELMSHEYFALAWPEPEPGLCMADLLEGLADER
jgi:N-acetyl-1-D-myo-inositol-2-amino-2-deoxy-alpha-D-glucopyranoside deacetylase